MKKILQLCLLLLLCLVNPFLVEAALDEDSNQFYIAPSIEYAQCLFKGDLSAIDTFNDEQSQHILNEWKKILEVAGSYKDIEEARIFENEDSTIVMLLVEHSKKYSTIFFTYNKNKKLIAIGMEVAAIYTQEDLMAGAFKYRKLFFDKDFDAIMENVVEEKKHIFNLNDLEKLHAKVTKTISDIGPLISGEDIKTHSIGGYGHISLVEKYEKKYLLTLFIFNQQLELHSIRFHVFDTKKEADAFRENNYVRQ